jgi:cytochrome P450
LGEGLLVSEGDFWKRQRRLAAPSFKRSEIKSYAETMVRRANEYAESIQQGSKRDIHHDMLGLTLNIVADALLGASAPPAQEVGEVLEVIMTEYQELGLSWRGMFPDWVPFRSRRRLKRQRQRLEGLIGALIDDKRRHHQNESDLLSRLIEATDEQGERMSDAQLLDETVTVFLAGHETVALTLSYCLDLLARHPEKQQALRSELATVLGGRAPSAESYEKLSYTRAVVNEALRLYPPAWGFGRETIRPITLAGAEVPARVRLIACPWVMHRDERWFEDPLDFRPERWLDGSSDSLPRYAYLPFGAGPRICIGNHFALMEAVLVLAALLARHEVTGASPKPPALNPSITLRPKDTIELVLR